ncbi:MAG: hypothetical protein V6Z86_00830 [Hyphomicrobiales bacterium]
MFANLREVEPALIKVLDLTDCARLQEAYKSFLAFAASDACRLGIILTSHTGWPLQELLALENQELIAWSETLRYTSRVPQGPIP